MGSLIEVTSKSIASPGDGPNSLRCTWRDRRDPTNAEIAAALDELGDLYELDGAVIHRIVAYRNAAKAVRDAPVSVAALAREGRATELAGIGATIQEKVLALADDGAIPALVKLRAKFPPGLIEMTQLPGLGPKRARRLFDELGIDSLEALRAAAEEQQIRELKGFGPKAEESILAALDAAGARRARPAFRARPRARRRRAADRRAARAPGRRAGGARRLGAPVDRQRQGPRRDRHRDRPARARAGRRRA